MGASFSLTASCFNSLFSKNELREGRISTCFGMNIQVPRVLMIMERPMCLVVLFFFLFFSFSPDHQARVVVGAQQVPISVGVGVVLDLDTPAGKRSWTSISMAIDDFYAVNKNYSTRVVLHARDSMQDAVGAASAALDLLKNTQVQAIIGPETSAQALFLIDLGNKSQVPLLSFSATSPFLSSSHMPYFVRTTMNDSSQIGAIAEIVKSFGWRQVVPIYEDTEYGAGIIPYFVDAFQAIDVHIPYRSVIPSSASQDQLTTELYKLMTMQTRVFVVHMMPALGSRLFETAEQLGLMAEGYVWISTDSIANTMAFLDDSTIQAMQGVLGVRPYIPKSKVLDSFRTRLRARFRRDNPNTDLVDPTFFQLWAYDTAWALALAVEKAGISSSSLPFKNSKNANNSTDLESLRVSRDGPKLLQAIKNTRFHGVAGDFQLVDGQLQSSAFEILNGNNARGIGFWTPANGLARQLNYTINKSFSAVPTDNLKPIIWPGESTALPKGWETPTNGKKLRIGVPVKTGFNQFVNVAWDDNTNSSTVTGFCIDVFDAVVKMLPYSLSYEYVPFRNASSGESAGSYDDLVYQVFIQLTRHSTNELVLGFGEMVKLGENMNTPNSRDILDVTNILGDGCKDCISTNYLVSAHISKGKLDAVVGDVTIVANRSNYVDFTLPFTESGVSMVVPIKDNGNKNGWIFLKPLTTDLWLGSLGFFIFTGLVVWVLEHRINEDFRGPPSQQLGLVFYFIFSTLVFAHKERLQSNLSRFAMIIWVFVVLILTSSYTASLTSLLTVQQLQPTVADVNELLKNGDYVGFQDGSFVGGLLKQMKFDELKLRNLSTPDEYADSLSNGSQQGGVAAIFDEVPYLRLFLSEHCSNYTMVGPTYKTGGFGFAFPRGSSLVHDLSRAVLNVTEGDTMTEIERKWFGDPSACATQSDNFSSTRLDFQNFGGLFLITGVVSLLALLIFLFDFLYREHKELRAAAAGSSIGRRLKAWATYFDSKNLKSGISKTEKEEIVLDGAAAASNIDGSQSPYSNFSDVNFGPIDEGLSSTEPGTPGMESPLPEVSIERSNIRSQS